MAGILCISGIATIAQTALKIKLQPIAASIPAPPASLEEAYKYAHPPTATVSTVNTRQAIYQQAQDQLAAVMTKLEANPNEAPKTTEQQADVAVSLAKSGNAFVNGSPEMQAAMKAFYLKLQGDEKFAAAFEEKSEEEKIAYIQQFLSSYHIKAPSPSAAANKSADPGKEAIDIRKLTEEMLQYQQALDTKYYRPLSKPDESAHQALSAKEAAELKALPIVKMGEYSGADPLKEKQIRNKYFNEHMKVAKAQLERDHKLWQQYKTELLAGLARFDGKLEAIDWGGKLVNPLLKPGIASIQKGLLEMTDHMVACEHIMTWQAASWYAGYLGRPETAARAKEITMAYAGIL